MKSEAPHPVSNCSEHTQLLKSIPRLHLYHLGVQINQHLISFLQTIKVHNMLFSKCKFGKNISTKLQNDKKIKQTNKQKTTNKQKNMGTKILNSCVSRDVRELGSPPKEVTLLSDFRITNSKNFPSKLQ